MSFFSKLFKNSPAAIKPESIDADLILRAPVNGTILPLKEVPNVVISEKLIGDGIAFIPDNNQILAPCDGIITRLISSNNGFAIRSVNGIEIYITCGLGSRRYVGEGFTAHKKVGDEVKAGELVLSFDMATVSKTLSSNVVSVIVIKSSASIAKVTAASGQATAGQTQCVWVELDSEVHAE